MSYNDVFNEQLVVKQGDIKDTLKKVGIIIGGIILAGVVTFIPIIASIGMTLPLILLIIWGAVFLIRRFNVEYEYILTNSELDIDKIFNRSKRKRAFTFDVKDFQVMVKHDHVNYKSEIGNTTDKIDYSSGVPNDNTFHAVIEQEGKRKLLVIEPNEQMLRSIKMFIPRKVKE